MTTLWVGEAFGSQFHYTFADREPARVADWLDDCIRETYCYEDGDGGEWVAGMLNDLGHWEGIEGDFIPHSGDNNTFRICRDLDSEG